MGFPLWLNLQCNEKWLPPYFTTICISFPGNSENQQFPSFPDATIELWKRCAILQFFKWSHKRHAMLLCDRNWTVRTLINTHYSALFYCMRKVFQTFPFIWFHCYLCPSEQSCQPGLLLSPETWLFRLQKKEFSLVNHIIAHTECTWPNDQNVHYKREQKSRKTSKHQNRT